MAVLRSQIDEVWNQKMAVGHCMEVAGAAVWRIGNRSGPFDTGRCRKVSAVVVSYSYNYSYSYF